MEEYLCRKHLEARTRADRLPIDKLFSELSESEVHCSYDCDGKNGNCSGYEVKRMPFVFSREKQK